MADRFQNLRAMDFMAECRMLAGATAVLGAMDILFGEVDR